MGHDYTYDPDDKTATPAKGGELVVRDTATGEERKIVPFPNRATADEPLALRDSTFKGSGAKPLLVKQAKVLRAPVDPVKEVDILPTSEVYVSHVHYRRRLNNAVGPMGWLLRPLGNVAYDPTSNDMYREWALVILGRVVGTSFGSIKYQPTNKRMDFADAAEGVKSNALTRICKDLGIAAECWDRRWCDAWRDEHAVHVYAMVKKWRKGHGEVLVQEALWRRIDAKPFYKEISPVEDSPNQDRWRAQMTAWIHLLESEKAKSKEIADRLREAKKGAAETVKATAQVIDEVRSAGGDVPAQSTTSRAQPAGTQPPQIARTPISHGNGNIDPADRPYMIRDCRIRKRTEKYVLYEIVMLDGQSWFTFSSSVYAKMQLHFASRDVVEIKKYETHREGDKKYRTIKSVDDILVLKTNSAAQPREPGEEG